jgi:hypothetical protein
MFEPNQSYQSKEQCTLVVFDDQIPGFAERFHQERMAWAQHADIEAQEQERYVLIVRPGGAARRQAT